jgi:hypothetical protein
MHDLMPGLDGGGRFEMPAPVIDFSLRMNPAEVEAHRVQAKEEVRARNEGQTRRHPRHNFLLELPRDARGRRVPTAALLPYA